MRNGGWRWEQIRRGGAVLIFNAKAQRIAKVLGCSAVEAWALCHFSRSFIESKKRMMSASCSLDVDPAWAWIIRFSTTKTR